ncbi:type II toxin-antitoxin system RelE/ParE family toxin [soil metagenome]
MRPLRVRALARREIDEAFDWYPTRSHIAALGFLDALDEVFLSMGRAPEQHLVVRGLLRRALLNGYPYAVYYKSFPAVISVVGAIHGHRHPQVWLRRG